MSQVTSVTLLGPQRHKPIIKDVLEDFGIEGQLAVITGGWEEREAEVDDLDQHLGRPVRSLYGLTLPRMELLLAERSDALRAVSDLDHHYLTQIRGIHQAFLDLWDPTLNPSIAETRAELKEELQSCGGVLIAGGNVSVLLDQLYLLKLRPLLGTLPIVAWSAGAMVLTDRIVLFHDNPPQGRGDPEIYDDGLRLAPRLVALPHAKHRLKLGDERRVGILAGRFAPATCVALDEGNGVHWDGYEWRPIGGARALVADGQVVEMVNQ